MSTRVEIEYADQFNRWHHLQTKYNQQDAYRSAKHRARANDTAWWIKTDDCWT